MIGIIIAIAMYVRAVMTHIILPLIPFVLYLFIVVVILTICVVIAGVGGSMLFYVIVFFYVRALLSYNPVLEARKQAEQAAQMQQAPNEG